MQTAEGLSEFIAGTTGLPKRELFAAMAMQGVLARPNHNPIPTEVAQDAADNADALLAELAKGEE